MSPSKTYTSWDIKISLIVFNEAKQRQFQKWNEDDLRNEDSLNNEDDLRNEDNLKNEDDLRKEDELHPVQAHTTLVVFVCTVNMSEVVCNHQMFLT